jgi:phage terminase small subunit
MADQALTQKQQLFCEFYMGDAAGNGALAAKMAGYRGSDATLAQIAYENLKRPVIAGRIAQRVSQAGMGADECLALLADIARRDDREFVQIRTDARGNVVEAKIVLADKIRALELIGKYLKLFVQQVEVSTPLPKALIGVDLTKIV